MRFRPVFAVLLASCAACGGDSSSSNRNNPTNPNTIAISAGGGVSPKQLMVPPGTLRGSIVIR